MSDNVTKRYSNGEITVIWQPAKCIHSTKCWRELGRVFKPKEHPWIKIDAATSDEITAQVDRCPSGALSWKKNEGEQGKESEG